MDNNPKNYKKIFSSSNGDDKLNLDSNHIDFTTMISTTTSTTASSTSTLENYTHHCQTKMKSFITVNLDSQY